MIPWRFALRLERVDIVDELVHCLVQDHAAFAGPHQDHFPLKIFYHNGDATNEETKDRRYKWCFFGDIMYEKYFATTSKNHSKLVMRW